jgi:hypothetical protein
MRQDAVPVRAQDPGALIRQHPLPSVEQAQQAVRELLSQGAGGVEEVLQARGLYVQVSGAPRCLRRAAQRMPSARQPGWPASQPGGCAPP